MIMGLIRLWHALHFCLIHLAMFILGDPGVVSMYIAGENSVQGILLSKANLGVVRLKWKAT